MPMLAPRIIAEHVGDPDSHKISISVGPSIAQRNCALVEIFGSEKSAVKATGRLKPIKQTMNKKSIGPVFGDMSLSRRRIALSGPTFPRHRAHVFPEEKNE